MGATCSPSDPADEDEEEVVVNMESKEGDKSDQANEKFASILNDYQADNEKLRDELDSLKHKNNENIINIEEKTRRNEEVMRELDEMKALLDVKSRAIARGRLEAALLKSIVSMESTMKLYKKGELVHHRMNRKIHKYAEVRVCEGEVVKDDYKAGYVMLTFSDDKGAETAERCQVLDVVDDADNKEKDHIFTVKVSDEDVVKDIRFSCESAKQKGDWVRAITKALGEVTSTNEGMYELFTLKLEFSKEKMGIRVEESPIDDVDDEKSEKEKLRASGIVKKAIKNIENAGKDALSTVEKVAADTEKGKDKPDEVREKKEENNDEPPCELLVTNITDEDLIAAGLKVNCVVVAINDKPLEGLVYSEQLDLLRKTPKPYTLTFNGENYLKHKPQPKHGYQSILKEITADEDNSVKRAFNELVEGSKFERELEASTDKKGTIEKLLCNQRRLMALLQNFDIQDIEL